MDFMKLPFCYLIFCKININKNCIFFKAVTIISGPYIRCNYRVETGYKTSTVALRVVEGDEKGTQCLGA
jgi:hypothetical protein